MHPLFKISAHSVPYSFLALWVEVKPQFGITTWGRKCQPCLALPTIDYYSRMSGRILIDRSLVRMGRSHRYITNSRQRLSMSEVTCWSQCQTATTAGYCKGDLQWAATSVFFVEASLKSFRCWCRYRAIISGAFQMTRLHQCLTSACRNSMQFFQIPRCSRQNFPSHVQTVWDLYQRPLVLSKEDCIYMHLHQR